MRRKKSLWWDTSQGMLYKIHVNRTGRPPIRETAASLISELCWKGPSGTPNKTEDSMRESSSESESLYIFEKCFRAGGGEKGYQPWHQDEKGIKESGKA